MQKHFAPTCGHRVPALMLHICIHEVFVRCVCALKDELAERSSPTAEQPDPAALPNALQEEAAVAVRPDPEQDAAGGKHPQVCCAALMPHCLVCS